MSTGTPSKRWPSFGKLILIVIVSILGTFSTLWGTSGWESFGPTARWAWLGGGSLFCAICLTLMERRP